MKQSARNIITVLLVLLLTFSLCSCEVKKPPAEKTPAPTESIAPTPKPETALDRWLARAETRYNMKYDNFNDYWCLLCDEYFGDSMHTLLDTVSVCENANYDLKKNNEQIESKRSDYRRRSGKDWHFEITEHHEQALDDTACKNFSDELQSIHDLISAVTSKAPSWSDYDWAEFAQSMGCEVEQAKSIIDAYSAIAQACNEIKVSSALAIELTVKFSDGSTVTDSTTLYEINGEYVSTELIDSASMLIQLIYF